MSRKLALAGVFLAVAVGCDGGPKLAQLSGTVTFKGQPVPAGYITFTPPSGGGTVRVVQVKDGKFDTAEMVGDEKGVHPGPNAVRIAGFDGVKVKFWGQGKQIFNPVDQEFNVPAGASKTEFVVPESAGKNVKIEPTADE
jgi:hypothetical protein